VTVGLVLLVGLSILAVLTPWYPAFGLPAAWFLVAISPVSNLFFPIGILVAERTLYLPSVAISMLAAFTWQILSDPGRKRRSIVLASGLAVVTLAMGLRTWTRNPVWASTSSALTSVVRDRPESYRAQWLIAATRQHSGDRARAALDYEAAYRIYPHNSELMTDYAEFLVEERRFDRAIALLEQANRMHPYILRSASLQVWAYLAAGRYADALPVIQKVEDLGGSNELTMPLRAYAYEHLGKYELSVAAWRLTLREPAMQTWRNWSFLARSLAAGGHGSQALAAAAQARTLAQDPAAITVVNSLLDALRIGCYQIAAAPGQGALRERQLTTGRDCDPLGDWLALKGLQTAKHSQNAMVAGRPRSGGGPAEKP